MENKKFYTHKELHNKWMKDASYVREYQKLEPEYQIARAIIEARLKKSLTQQELAEKANTGQAVISRLENMRGVPSLFLVQRVAEALGLRVQIRLLAE